MSFLEYLNLKDITQVDSFMDKIDYTCITENEVKEHLNVISEFHRNVNGFKGNPSTRIESSIGKILEENKVNTKKIKKYYMLISSKQNKNEFEKFFLNKGSLYIERAEQSINAVYENNYMGLIMRSMRNKEICLGLAGFNNIRKNDGIKVVDIRKCSYNMVEMDAIYVLSRIKKKERTNDFKSLIQYYCNLENLDLNSGKYMCAMLSYPNEFMKCCNRYSQNRKQWDEKKYIEKFKKAIEQDGDSLI